MKAQQEETTPLSKRALQKEIRCNEIIEAGLLEFAAQGFTSTKLDAVAERAGVAKGTIYLYFDSKERLFEAVVRKNLSPENILTNENIAEYTGSMTELLSQHLREMYTVLHSQNIPALVAIVMGEVNRFPKLVDFFFNEMVSKKQGSFHTIIERGIANKEFIESGIENYIQILISPAIMSAIWNLQFENHAPLDVDEYAQVHIDFVLRGLGVK